MDLRPFHTGLRPSRKGLPSQPGAPCQHAEGEAIPSQGVADGDLPRLEAEVGGLPFRVVVDEVVHQLGVLPWDGLGRMAAEGAHRRAGRPDLALETPLPLPRPLQSLRTAADNLQGPAVGRGGRNRHLEKHLEAWVLESSDAGSVTGQGVGTSVFRQDYHTGLRPWLVTYRVTHPSRAPGANMQRERDCRKDQRKYRRNVDWRNNEHEKGL